MRHFLCNQETYGPTTMLSNGRYVLLNQDSTLTWCSVEKDHLGSSRVVMEETPGINRLQINHYYPFGNTFGEYNHCDENTDLQRYKFNGKELDLVHGLRLYDYGARMYDQILGCWTSVDPMAEKYYHISPYVFCFDNPVRMVDRDGKDPWDFFPTADAAAIDFGYFYNDNSIRENREYASNIFRVRNAQGKIGYTYDVATSGGTKNITVLPPKNFEREALIHTHAAYDSKLRNDEFSGVCYYRNGKYIYYDNLKSVPYYNSEGCPTDIGTANTLKKNVYLVAPNGSLQKYTYKAGRISIISSDMPSDLNDPGVLNSRSSFLESHPLDMKNLLDIYKKMLRLNNKTYE